MCQNEFASRNTNLAHKALHLVLGRDLTVVDDVTEDAVSIAVGTSGHSFRLVPFVGLAESIQQVILSPEPPVDSGLDLP